MKKFILLTAMIISPTISFAADASMDCTQAVAWLAKKIIDNQPPNTEPKVWKKGQPQTLAIELINMLPQSPCRTNLSPEKNPASGKADGKNRGAKRAAISSVFVE